MGVLADAVEFRAVGLLQLPPVVPEFRSQSGDFGTVRAVQFVNFPVGRPDLLIVLSAQLVDLLAQRLGRFLGFSRRRVRILSGLIAALGSTFGVRHSCFRSPDPGIRCLLGSSDALFGGQLGLAYLLLRTRLRLRYGGRRCTACLGDLGRGLGLDLGYSGVGSAGGLVGPSGPPLRFGNKPLSNCCCLFRLGDGFPGRLIRLGQIPSRSSSLGFGLTRSLPRRRDLGLRLHTHVLQLSGKCLVVGLRP